MRWRVFRASHRRNDDVGERLTFSGIGVYRPELFAPVPAGGRAPLAPLLRAAVGLSCVGSVKAAPLERLAELAGPAFETGARWSILIIGGLWSIGPKSGCHFSDDSDAKIRIQIVA